MTLSFRVLPLYGVLVLLVLLLLFPSLCCCVHFFFLRSVRCLSLLRIFAILAERENNISILFVSHMSVSRVHVRICANKLKWKTSHTKRQRSKSKLKRRRQQRRTYIYVYIQILQENGRRRDDIDKTSKESLCFIITIQLVDSYPLTCVLLIESREK